ncbi:MAG: DUF4831 family protein [Bacteroidaceae bacterium]|nr:DUF4831 family protein [Bacteroidaceae bacterium]
MKKIFLFAAFVTGVSLKAQISTFNPSVTTDGVNYILPKTAIRADVYAIKTTFVPGEYAKYAQRYLHMSGDRPEMETQWRVTSINVRKTGVVDTLKRFSVKSKDKNMLPKVQLSQSGILLSINENVREDIPEVPGVYSTNHKLDYRKYLTEDMLAATSQSKMAELVAQEILDIRECKNAIKRGQADNMPKDGVSMKLVLGELNAQEEALTQMFIGYTDTVYYAKSFTMVPTEDVDKKIMFRFSKDLGFVDSDDLAGAPFYLDVKDKHSVALPSEKDMAKRKITGIVYNVPGLATVRLYSATKTYYDNEMPFAQFGTIDMLSSTLFKENVTTKVIFDSATGAVSQVK